MRIEGAQPSILIDCFMSSRIKFRKSILAVLTALFFLSGCSSVSVPYSGEGERLYESLLPSVVTIRIGSASGETYGTGFIIDESSGTILTCQHLLATSRRLSGRLTDSSTFLPLTVVKEDPSLDLAVLAFSEGHMAPQLHRLRSLTGRDARPGEPIFSIGTSGGFEFSAMNGIVSGLARGSTSSKHENSSFLQISGLMHQGASGSPIVGYDGKLLGIASRKSKLEGLVFAVPFSQIAVFVSGGYPGLRHDTN